MGKDFNSALHVKAKEQIESYIKTILLEITINKGMVDTDFIHNKLISKIDGTLKSEHFDRITIFLYIYEKVFANIVKHFAVREKVNGKLKELINTDELGSQISRELLSYPEEYVAFLSLPNVTLDSEKPIKISDTISVLKTNDDLHLKSSSGGIKAGISALLGSPSPIDKDKTFLSMCFTGFLSNFSETPSVKSIIGTLKQIIASFVVTDVLSPTYSPPYPFMEKKEFCYFYLSTNFQDTVHSKEFSELISNFLQKLQLNKKHMLPNSIEKILHPERDFDSPEVKGELLQDYINDTNIAKLFSTSIDNKAIQEIERVRASLEWYFEGLVSDNDTFSYILFFTAIEALLGERDKDRNKDLTDRISDRCAFLLAKDSVSRKQIKQFFEKAYETRSNIIHKGLLKLPEEQQSQLFRVRKHTRELLQKEILNIP